MHKLSTLEPQEIGTLVALVEQDRLSEAEQQTRALLTEHPNTGLLWKILSVALVRQGKDALQSLRRATELMPLDPEAHRNLGAALYDHGQWAAALLSLQSALALQPDDVDALVDAANAMRALGRAREAIPLYGRALQLNPREAEAHNNLGNTHLELGQYQDAVGCYRRALKIKPNDVRILCNLGLSLTALGERVEAVASYRLALRLNPRDVEVVIKLGNTLRDLGERREALSVYAQALKLDPGRAETHCNLGNVLFELRRVDEAVASYHQALRLKPDFALAHVSLGLALRQQRRPAEAEGSCQAALAIDLNCVEALCLLGELRVDRGLVADAENLFQQALSVKPDFPFAYASIAAHRKLTIGDTDWLRGAHALLAKSLPLADGISLHYALGKYYGDLGQYDTAFGHYRQANELTKRYGAKYDGATFTRRVDRLIQRFDRNVGDGQQAAASTSDLPVIIIGMPRSGTSLVEQILASHPAVFGAGEVVFWNAAYNAYESTELEHKMTAELLSSMARDYLDRLTASSGGALRVVDKMPANFLYAGLIVAALPRARVIHMQRHPIDTCLSIYFQNFFNIGPYANDLSDLAHYYGEYVRITNHWRTALPATTLLEVPYEALIEDPEGWIRRMLEFIGLPWDARCLDFQQTDRVVVTASRSQVRQKLSKESIGRWRNYEPYIGPLRLLTR